MAIDSAIYDRLNDSTITSTVGTRIYPNEAPEDSTFPMVVYHVENPITLMSMAGATGLQQYTLTVEMWTKSLAELVNLSTAILARINGYSGGNLKGCFVADQTREKIETADEGDIAHGTQQYTVWATA